jgi:hypothetical protein
MTRREIIIRLICGAKRRKHLVLCIIQQRENTITNLQLQYKPASSLILCSLNKKVFRIQKSAVPFTVLHRLLLRIFSYSRMKIHHGSHPIAIVEFATAAD